MNIPRASAAAAVCSIAAWACSSPSPVPDLLVQPPEPATRGTSPPAGPVLTIVEHDEDGGVHAVTRSTSIVDINSVLDLTLDKDALRTWMAEAFQIADAGFDDQDLADMTQLRGWAQRGLESLPTLQRGLEEYVALNRELKETQAPAVREEIQERMIAALGEAMDGPAQLASDIQAKAGEEPEGSLNQRINAGLAGRPNQLQIYRAVFEAAAAEANAIAARFDAAIASQSIHVQLGAWTISDGVPTPRHLEGFDSYPEGEYFRVERWAVLPDDEDLKKIRRLEEEAKQLEDGKEGHLDYLETAVRASAQGLVDAVGRCETDLRARFDSAERTFEGLGQEADDLVAYYRERIEEIERDTTVLVDRVRRLAEEYLTGNFRTRGSGLADWIQKARDDFDAVRQDVGNLRTKIDDLTLTEPIEELFASMDEGVRSEAAGAIGDLKGCKDLLRQEALMLADGLRTMLGITNANLEVNVEALEFGEEVTSHTLETIPTSTSLDLNRTGRRGEGDVLAFKLAAGRVDSETGEAEGKMTPVAVNRLEMQRVLPHFESTVGLIFANPNGNPVGSEWQIGPSYSVLLKKGSRDHPLYNRLFDPGIGLNLAAIDFDDDETPELGIGAVLSLVRDYVQVGYGYDVFEDRWYAFFGLSLPLPGGSLPMMGGSADGVADN